MREIKFRVFDKRVNHYWYWELKHDNRAFPKVPCGVYEQYTGLKDWYEGDIIVDKYGNQAVIVFKNTSFRAEPINGGNVRGPITGFDRKIGNIHEGGTNE